ncbi:MAG: cupin domain-containing protein [Alphaproteobacteria bacterium]
MTVQFADVVGQKKLKLGHSKRTLIRTPDFHVWVHADEPGTKGPMHTHTADETFYCLQGECTFTLKEASGKRYKRKLTPGMIVMIPKGDFYQLHNTGDEYLVLLGTRGETDKKPRFGKAGEKVGHNNWAIENKHVIEARKTQIARKAKAPAKKKAAVKVKARKRA